MAQSTAPFTAFVDPDAECFLAPGDMPARIRAYCQETGQAIPADAGQVVRVALESLAFKYRCVLDALEAILGRRLECIHIVGGGIQNRLLCQFTAAATGRPVVAGPLEATAIGNLMLQLMGLGQMASLAEIRQVVRHSFAPVVYEPEQAAAWDAAYDRFRSLLPPA